MEASVPASPPDQRPGYVVVEYGWPPESEAAIRAAYPDHRAHIDALGVDGDI